MDYELDKRIIALIVITIVCTFIAIGFYYITPKIPNPHYYRISFETHGINYFTYELKSNTRTYTDTVTDKNYTTIILGDTYDVNACFYNIDGYPQCEGRQNITIDKDMRIELFAGRI